MINNTIIVVVLIVVITNMIYGETTSLKPSTKITNVPYSSHERHSSFRLEIIRGGGHKSQPSGSDSNHTKTHEGDYCNSNGGYKSTGCIVEIVLLSVLIPCIILCLLFCIYK